MSTIRWKRAASIAALGLLLAAAPQEGAPAPIERQGTFVPAAAAEVRLELEAYQGPFELLEVAAHGTAVRAGDTLARIKLEAIDRAIEAAERDLRSTEIRHQNQREQARLEQEAAEQRLADAAEAIDQAEKALALYEQTELELKRRGVELSDGYAQDNLDDQKDELAQLEKMYTADELTDATEEIVLKRSRRQLARSLASYEIQKARRKIDDEVNEPEVAKQKKKAVRDARTNRDRLARQAEMEKRSRDDGLSRLEPEMDDARGKVAKLRRDREKLTVRAPQPGVVLHGGVDDYKPGRSAPRHEAGGSVAAGAKLFAIAKPGAMAVALDVPEAQLFRIDQGMAVKVVPAADAARSWVGRLRCDRFPAPRSAGAPENAYDAEVELDGALEPAYVPGMRVKVVIDWAARGGA